MGQLRLAIYNRCPLFKAPNASKGPAVPRHSAKPTELHYIIRQKKIIIMIKVSGGDF